MPDEGRKKDKAIIAQPSDEERALIIYEEGVKALDDDNKVIFYSI